MDTSESEFASPKNKRKNNVSPFFIPAMISSVVGMDGFGGLWRQRKSSQKERNNPNRTKTIGDLEKLNKAEEKRKRKELKHK